MSFELFVKLRSNTINSAPLLTAFCDLADSGLSITLPRDGDDKVPSIGAGVGLLGSWSRYGRLKCASEGGSGSARSSGLSSDGRVLFGGVERLCHHCTLEAPWGRAVKGGTKQSELPKTSLSATGRKSQERARLLDDKRKVTSMQPRVDRALMGLNLLW
jgi:hypothetical protein